MLHAESDDFRRGDERHRAAVREAVDDGRVVTPRLGRVVESQTARDLTSNCVGTYTSILIACVSVLTSV